MFKCYLFYLGKKVEMSFNKTLQQNNKKHIKPVIIHFKPTTDHDLQLSPVILCRKRWLTWVACVTKTGSEIGIVISLTRKTERSDFSIQLGYVLRDTILQAKKKEKKKKRGVGVSLCLVPQDLVFHTSVYGVLHLHMEMSTLLHMEMKQR